METRRGRAVVRVGVVGLGHWGPKLCRAFSALPDVELVAVADRDAVRRELAAAQLPGAVVLADGMRVIADDTIDAVVIATPAATHWPLVHEALLHDKHVFVEKPLAASAASARDLVLLAEKQARVLAVGHIFLFNGAVLAVKELLDRRELGDIHHVAAVRANFGPVRRDVNAAWDLAAHDVSIANLWFGSSPTHVSAAGRAWSKPGIEDVVFSTLTYPGDILVNVHCSWLHPCKVCHYTVVGSARMLEWDDLDDAAPIRLIEPGADRHDAVVPRLDRCEPLARECRAFIDDIVQGTEPVNDGWFALDVTRVLDAISTSLAHDGRRVAVSGG